MKNWSLLVVALYWAFHAGSSVAQQAAQGTPADLVVRLTSVDFAPEDGKSYELKWPGPPRRPWTDADKKTFVVTGSLSAPAPEDFSLAFLIKENKTWDIDPVLSAVVLNFKRGDTTTQNRFWLTCNKKGRIQGDLGRDFDGYGNLYLYSGSQLTDAVLDNWALEVVARRTQHAVQCK